jgi:pSer/pThr/pTyr-binding forkhead associated (FHA) protein
LPVSLPGETTVSRRHAEIVRAGDRVVVEDLGSTNGTFVNDSPVTGERELASGDEVRFGAARLRYEA